MNGIKRSLLVSCLFVSVGSSIQQPLYAGRPGEELQKIVALVRNDKEALFLLGSKIVELMLTVHVSKLFWHDEVARFFVFFFVLIGRNEHFADELLSLDHTTRPLIVKRVCLLKVFYYCCKVVFNSRPFLLKEQTSSFYKKMLYVGDNLDKISSIVMYGSFAVLIKNILVKYFVNFNSCIKVDKSSFERFMIRMKRFIKSTEGITLCSALVIEELVRRRLSFIGKRRRYELLKQL